MKEFTPMGDIPSLGRLTVYMGGSIDLAKELLQEFIDEVKKGTVKLNIDRIFNLDDVPLAHQYMEESKHSGKLVVLVNDK